MLLQNQHPLNKSLTVSVLGVPNVGKSSLINYLLGVDLSIVSERPHTTRNRFSCVLTVDRTEIILIDTPGIHRSGKEFGRRLNQQARDALGGADVYLLLIDSCKELSPQLSTFVEIIETEVSPVWIVATKIDLLDVDGESLAQKILTEAQTLLPNVEKVLAVSAKDGTNMNLLTGTLCDAARSGPHFYPDGSISNKNQRFFACEYVREQIFELLKDELPFESAVIIEDFKEDFEETSEEDQETVHISAAILVHRPGQRAIVVGSKGRMIKQIGSRARKKIEAMLGKKVCLLLHVKILSKWFKNHFVLEELGLPRAVDSARFWHKREPKVLEKAEL